MSEKTTAIPFFESELILAHILKKSREYVLTHPEIELTKKQTIKYQNFIKRRLNHEPMAYILGHKEFYGLDFKVTRDTLIPRPETELLVEKTLEKIRPAGHQAPSAIIDVGTGSGNIIISIARCIKQPKKNKIDFYGTDISPKALRVAKSNAKKHNVEKKIKFIQSDLLNYFLDHHSLFTGRCVIVANLPYLSQKIYSKTLPDVKNFEPKSALYASKKGLYHYEKLFQQIKNILSRVDHCSIIVEISPEQKDNLLKLAEKNFPKANTAAYKDLAEKWRVCRIDIQ